MKIDILSLFPEYFKSPFDASIIGQARKRGVIEINLIDLRDFADNAYRRVDDRPYGGGPGMVLMPEPVARAIRKARTPHAHVVYMSPQGRPLDAAKSRELASHEHLILLCGHYEGIDERVLNSDVDEEISIGDYVLTNGCLAAIVLVDALVRFVPGVLGHEAAASEDSFEFRLVEEECLSNVSQRRACSKESKENLEKGFQKKAFRVEKTLKTGKSLRILDCPHYTRPEIFEGQLVPNVLLSGNHEKIKEWRLQEALKKTKRVRPDLMECKS